MRIVLLSSSKPEILSLPLSRCAREFVDCWKKREHEPPKENPISLLTNEIEHGFGALPPEQRRLM
ncbi:MAG: hypothetical protein J2P37_27745 [Ktedonobacteraceae bacterium]|nr:hypothetical protein [Ktedonobacteraceae bacterium]